jgi:hypothetical protein
MTEILRFMEIDVEGHEHAVLEGRSHDRTMPSECVDGNRGTAHSGRPRPSARFLRAIGLSGLLRAPGSLSEIADFNAQFLQREEAAAGRATERLARLSPTLHQRSSINAWPQSAMRFGNP